MNLIDETYFGFDPCFLGDFQGSNGFGEVLERKVIELRRSIERFEPKYLKLLMGSELYAEYVSTIEDAKWIPLISRLVDKAKKTSPIANYVYFYHRDEHKYEMGDNGDFMTKKDNMVVVPPEHKMMIAWNSMCDDNIEILDWIYNSIICSDTPAITTTAIWDYSMWEKGLLKKENGYL